MQLESAHQPEGIQKEDEEDIFIIRQRSIRKLATPASTRQFYPKGK